MTGTIDLIANGKDDGYPQHSSALCHRGVSGIPFLSFVPFVSFVHFVSFFPLKIVI